MRAPDRDRRLRLVLADDYDDVIEELKQSLTPEYEISEGVRDGRALVEAVNRHRPDAVVADFNMPELNGIEAGRAILQQGLCHAIVLLSM